MERSTFSEDNSVPFRIRRSLLGSLTLLHRSRRTYAAGKDGITSCLPTAQLSACLYLSLGTGPSLFCPRIDAVKVRPTSNTSGESINYNFANARTGNVPNPFTFAGTALKMKPESGIVTVEIAVAISTAVSSRSRELCSTVVP